MLATCDIFTHINFASCLAPAGASTHECSQSKEVKNHLSMSSIPPLPFNQLQALKQIIGFK